LSGAEAMKKIEALIRHYKLEDVQAALTAKGVSGMTVTEVHGFGRQKGHLAAFRGREYAIDFVPKVKVEIVVGESELAEVIQTIIRAARTGQVGDGKIFVLEVCDAIRIRTGENGAEAL
jgi:nitrogen regulatory protein P-II 1